MRTTVIIYKRGDGYVADVAGQHGGGATGRRVGIEPYDAATQAARLMIQYGQPNPEGGDLMAPPEVMEHVPMHLRSVSARVDDHNATRP